jgi:hypothetical protein
MYYMRQYQRLLEEGRNLRRTIADALEVLREVGDFKDHHRAEVRVGTLPLPSGHVVGLVDLHFDDRSRENVFVVSLPSSTQFRAIRQGSSRHECFEISRLDGATVSAEARVLLADGTKVRAVEVIPTRLLYHPSKLDWRIVRHTISIIKAEKGCYRSLRQGLFPRPLRRMVPNRRFLDCSKLAGLKIERSLKDITREIGRKDPTLRRLSPQKVSDALRKFGIRIPQPH